MTKKVGSIAVSSAPERMRGITLVSGPGRAIERLVDKDSWEAPEVPRLPGQGSRLMLFDTARAKVAPTRAPGGSPATMYVCGITPYDATHLGHAATMVTFDVLQRVLRDSGLDVRFVQNVTDIDDPLLRRATRDGVDWIDLAVQETERFCRDMFALRVIPPEQYIGAVESIPGIVGKVTDLIDKGMAYRLDDGTGDVYFDLRAAPRFGSQCHMERDEMVRISRDRGGDPDRAGKKDPLDPLLWRGARPGEPAWEGGALGPGRPGWHIECAIIAQTFLGQTIDIQGGGSDLMFPHHECSAAHAEAISGEGPFAGHYVHTGMLELDGEKMSKRRGNLIFFSKMMSDKIDPMAIRLALLTDHYRGNRSWTPALLDASIQRLDTWRRAARAESGLSSVELLAGLRARLADDLDTPAAIVLLDNWAKATLRGEGHDPRAPRLMANAVNSLLGIALEPMSQ